MALPALFLTPPPMRYAQAPLDALRADLAAAPDDARLEREGGTWLVVAQAFHRLAELAPDDRGAYVGRLLDAWRANDELVERLPADLAPALAQAAGDEAGDAAAGIARTLAALGLLVEDMERTRAFHLAFTTLGLGRRAFAQASARSRGLVLVQQARVARQLGDLASAAELYDTADAAGREGGDAEVRGRAAIGHGLLANMRGNYPAARQAFGAALDLAGQVPSVSLLAHHGLMTGAISARDVETALVHGWRAFAGTVGDADRRADLLANLGEVSRMANAPDVALSCYLAALSLTRLDRICLAALGGGVLAAVDLGDVERLDALTREAEATIARSSQPYENAFALVELAEAHAGVGRMARAGEYAARAATLAQAGGFHEVAHRVELVRERLQRPAAEPRASRPARSDVRHGEHAVVSLTSAAGGVLGRLARLPADPAALVALEV
jgi:tetratricopeptide (TPR) repeat protein